MKIKRIGNHRIKLTCMVAKWVFASLCIYYAFSGVIYLNFNSTPPKDKESRLLMCAVCSVLFYCLQLFFDWLSTKELDKSVRKFTDENNLKIKL